MNLRAAANWLAVTALIVGTGCAGYRLGPTTGFPAGQRSLYVRPFVNRTPQPGLADEVTAAVRTAVLKDGAYRLVNRPEQADVVLGGDLVAYDRQGITFSARDALSVRDFEVTLTARVRAVRPPGDRVLWEREVRGRAVVPTAVDQISSERQNRPLLAEDLARHILVLLTDGDW